MQCELSTVVENKDTIKKILEESKTIAVIGLSPDESKASNMVSRYMQEQGYKIIPIYPKEDTILGQKVYRSLEEVEEKIDIVNIFRKPQVVGLVVDKVLSRSDVKCVWAQKHIVNNKAMQKAKDKGLVSVQDQCLMIVHKELFC
jgi:predicted CoA-binding protein